MDGKINGKSQEGQSLCADPDHKLVIVFKKKQLKDNAITSTAFVKS